MNTLYLPWPAASVCPVCAVAHCHRHPHNADSLYYQYRFYGIRGRWPTWADAISHCSPEMQSSWKQGLENVGTWTEPADGLPIGDPPAESIAQLVPIPYQPLPRKAP